MVAIAEDENSIHNIVEKWSEWEIANSVIFSAISQWEQVHFLFFGQYRHHVYHLKNQ
jgi:hypothetical protein